MKKKLSSDEAWLRAWSKKGSEPKNPKRLKYEAIWIDEDELYAWVDSAVENRWLANTEEARQKYHDALESEIRSAAKERYPNASIIVCNPSELNGNGEWGNTLDDRKRELPKSMYDFGADIPEGCEVNVDGQEERA